MSKLKEHYSRVKRKAKSVGGRSWLNAVTFVLIAVLIFAARDQLWYAWKLLGQVNIGILLLLIPVQFASYYANAEIFFTYLRARGQLRKTGRLGATSMALELNFVNHIFPSGGVSGISYMVWRLGKLGVAAGQATMAQLMRYVVQLAAFVVLLTIALVVATFQNHASNWVVVITAIAITALAFLVVFGSYLISSQDRLRSFARWLTTNLNILVKKATFGRQEQKFQLDKIENFFVEFHDDFMYLKRDKKLLIKPIIWAFVFSLLDVSLFIISFWALGISVDPAVLLIAYGAATAAGFLVLTPGGAGAYEAIMVGILAAGGMQAGAAFAGVVLTRAALIAGTLLTGFLAYHRALKKYGDPKIEAAMELKDNFNKSGNHKR